MFTLKKEGVLLDKTDFEFENEGVLNPAVIQEGDTVHVFYRAVRKGNHSTIGYCKLNGPLEVLQRNETPLLAPHLEYESQGIEDPRIVKIDDLYYMSFTAYDGVNAMGCLATSADLVNFDRQGIIVPQFTYEDFHRMAECNLHLNEKYKRLHLQNNVDSRNRKKILLSDKNVVFFPRKINGRFFFFHRIKPDIQIASVENIGGLTKAYWQDYLMQFDQHILITPKYEHEISYVGGGCPPIETEAGWLVIYHGVRDSVEGYVYCACTSLLDLNDPTIELARLPYPLFQPDVSWELKGEVNSVVFPTGTALFDDKLYIYYGAADTRIAVASVSLTELITELLNHQI
ncbi:glycoside hydrolase family 130 protein [Reichenbachiella agariperforans]|nr:pesticidal protein Cry7Aa [Reichenbachiella agariperforans]